MDIFAPIVEAAATSALSYFLIAGYTALVLVALVVYIRQSVRHAKQALANLPKRAVIVVVNSVATSVTTYGAALGKAAGQAWDLTRIATSQVGRAAAEIARTSTRRGASVALVAATVFCLATSAHAQQCRSYTFAALISMVDIRCSDHMTTTPNGEKAYTELVRTGRAEVASCAMTGAKTADALGDMGVLTALAMIDKLAGTSLYSPNNEQTAIKRCNALAKMLDAISPREPFYRKK